MQRENSSLLQGDEERRALKRPTGPAGSAMPEVPSQLSQHGASSSWKSRRVSSACSASERSAWLLGSAPPSQQPPGRGPGSWHAGSWSAWHLSAGQRGTGGCFSTSLSGPQPAPSSCSAERQTEAPTLTWRAWGALASAAPLAPRCAQRTWWLSRRLRCARTRQAAARPAAPSRSLGAPHTPQLPGSAPARSLR